MKRGLRRIRYKLNTQKSLNLRKTSQICLWLDGYDDLFSDFDPRPNSQRALSDDFLQEANRASKDKSYKGIELKFLVPKHKRVIHQEIIIKKRLKDHFKKHHKLLHNEMQNMIRQGILYIILGILLMFSASYILFNHYNNTLFLNFLIILLEPSGWFMFWEGLYLIVFEQKEMKPTLEFYEKMFKSKIGFFSY